MTQTRSIHAALKRLIRARGHTYADAAVVLGLSEASIKRLFSRAALSLQRLEALCNWLDVDIHELVRMSREAEPLTTRLSLSQERELMKDPGLLLVAFLLLNHWTQKEILDTYGFTGPGLMQKMFRLQDLGLVEVLPFDRVRLRTARNFAWRREGPVHRFFSDQVLAEFLDSRFESAGESMHFVSGMLSRASVVKLQESMAELARELDTLVEADLDRPVSERHGASLLLAIRPWEFSAFAAHRRPGRTKAF